MEQNSSTVALDHVNQIIGPVAEQLLNHLGDEQTTLESMLAAVRDVHQALLNLDDNALQKSLEAEARELSCNVAIQERRRHLQKQLATVLHLKPEEVTLRKIAAATSGSLRESIDQILRSLREMAAEVDRLNRQNAAMINQSLSIIRGVVERLAGVSGVGQSYNAVGNRETTHVGSLLQWGA